jgi:hypothetical protein
MVTWQKLTQLLQADLFIRVAPACCELLSLSSVQPIDDGFWCCAETSKNMCQVRDLLGCSIRAWTLWKGSSTCRDRVLCREWNTAYHHRLVYKMNKHPLQVYPMCMACNNLLQGL